MALKIADHLFTGPFDVEKTVVRKNHLPAVYAVLSKEGQPWDPLFRVLEIGASGQDGITFSNHARRGEWTARARGQICVYLMSLEGPEWQDVAARQSLAEQLGARHVPPNDVIGVTG